MTTRETEGWKLEDVSERVSKVKKEVKNGQQRRIRGFRFQPT